jgi:hypothetical protein
MLPNAGALIEIDVEELGEMRRVWKAAAIFHICMPTTPCAAKMAKAWDDRVSAKQKYGNREMKRTPTEMRVQGFCAKLFF